MNQKDLINSIQQLKGIKPRKEWALLVKSQILEEKKVEAKQPSIFAGIADVFSGINFNGLFQRKLVYAFATLALFVIGIFGFVRYGIPGTFPVKNMAEQSQASLIGQVGLRQSATVLNSKISNLAQVAKSGNKTSIPSVISEIKTNASELTKSIRNNSVNDPQTIKDIATSLKTLADVPGTDLTASADVKGLYEVVVKSQIEDLEKTTLTDEQKKTLVEIKSLYEQGKYADALEKILLINK